MDITYANGTPELVARYGEQIVADHVSFGKDWFSLFAVTDGVPVGVISGCGRNLPKPLENTREAFINIIEVRPEWQRKGIGTALVEGLLAWAREKGVAQVRAWSEEIRTEALMLWDKMGFTFSPLAFEDPSRLPGFYVAKRL